MNNAEKPEAPATTVEKTGEVKYDKTDLLKIFDELVFSGEYTEEVKIKGKLVVTFRTRSTRDAMEIARDIDKNSYNLISTLQQERAFQALVYSLAKYQARDLTVMNKEDRIKFINGLPLNIVDTISDALSRFDDKINQACKEGEENF